MSQKDHKIIGVDIGGTKIRSRIITCSGKLIGEPANLPTLGNESKEEIYGRISGSIDKVIQQNGLVKDEIAGIGLGVTGPLDTVNGLILDCPQLPSMHNFPLREMIRDHFDLPVVMDNDANALILGESIWGAGKGYQSVLGFTLGTGLGCALVNNMKLWTGTNGSAGEIWAAPYQEGTIEDIVSGRGISSLYFNYTGKHLTAEEISQLAEKGDPDAVLTWQVFAEALGTAVSWGINFFDPDLVVIGGSITHAWHYFYYPMFDYVKKHICSVPAVQTKIHKAYLGDDAGCIGAAAMVMAKLNLIFEQNNKAHI